MQVFTSVAELVRHLEWMATSPSDEIEAGSELDHGLQCSHLLRQSHPGDVELQVAGLIHDLAHSWDGPGQPRHASMGAKAVRGLLGDRIADLVGGHVAAKRYLVTTDAAYRAQLSPGSILTLAAQGGDYSEREIAAFRARPHWQAMLDLRRADERAKVPGAVVPGLDHWLDGLRHLTTM